VPVCSLILAVFLAHAFIGPFGRMIGDGVAFAVRHLNRQLRADWRRAVWLPLRAAGDYRCPRPRWLSICR
jgi:hypothetical protein